MSTTKKRPVAATIEQDESASIAAQRQAEYDDAKATRDRLAEESDALVSAEAIAASWAAGHEHHAAADHVEAQSARIRIDALLTRAVRQAKNAKARLVPSDLTLAQAAADALANAYGIEAQAVGIEPTPTYEDGAKPKLIVFQRGEYTRNVSGALAGELSVYLVRSELHRPLHGTDVLDKLEARDWAFPKDHDEAALGERCEGGEVDSFEVTVGRGYPGVPTLPAEVDVSSVSGYIASRVRPAYTDAIRRYGIAMPRVTTEADSPAVLISDETDDGTRTIVTQASFTLSHPHMNASDAISVVSHGVPEMLRNCYCAAGKITDARIVKAGPFAGSDAVHLKGIAVTIELTTISKVLA